MTESYLPSPLDPSSFRYVVGIAIGKESCSFCTLKPDKSTVIKPTAMANTAAGFAVLQTKLERIACASPSDPHWAGGHFALWGKPLPLSRRPRLHALSLASATNPPVCPNLAAYEGKPISEMPPPLHASCGVGEARPGYVPAELIVSYRELVRLHSQLTDEAVRYKNEIQARLSVLFPEFEQVTARPCRVTAVARL